MTLKQTIYILALFLTGHTLYGQNVQGYIDYNKVIVAMPKYAADQKELEARTNQLNDSITKLTYEFERFIQTKIPHHVKMDSVSRAELEHTLESLRMKIENYQHYAKSEINKLQIAIENNVKNIAVEELKTYCISKNIACVVDHKTVLYCSDCIDFTGEFANYLKQKF